MRKNIAAIFLLSAVLIINLYFRLFPAYFLQLKQEAHSIVHNEIQKKVKKEISITSSDFHPLAQEQLLKKSILEYERGNWAKIKKDVDRKYLELKSRYQDQNGQTYLMENDGWRWSRYTENVYLFGHPGDTVVNGKQIDRLMLAPDGGEVVSYQFLFYLSAWFYKAFSSVNNFLPISIFLFYLPLFFVVAFLFVMYLFCLSRIGNLGAFVACLFVGLAPIFLSRSCAGWFDTDVLILLFPLLVTWFYLNALTVKNSKARLGWLFLSSMFLGLFSFSWGYWWFILLIIIIFEIYSLIKIILLPARYEARELRRVQRTQKTYFQGFFSPKNTYTVGKVQRCARNVNGEIRIHPCTQFFVKNVFRDKKYSEKCRTFMKTGRKTPSLVGVQK